jgi:hypothetical protein
MPMALFRSYVRALPKLEAEESLRFASVMALGAGNMKPEDSKALGDALRKQAGIYKPRARATNKELRQIFGGG